MKETKMVAEAMFWFMILGLTSGGVATIGTAFWEEGLSKWVRYALLCSGSCLLMVTTALAVN
jgi:hypothetical protein